MLFRSDPTRVVRGARLAARLGFRFAEEVPRLLAPALLPEVVAGASRSRLREELLLTLEEEAFYRALALLAELGALKALYGLDLPPEAPFRRLRAEEGLAEARLLLLLFHQKNPLERAAWLALPGRLREGLALLLAASRGEEVPKEALGREPVRAAFLALFPEKEAWLKAERRVLMGRDLLKLGLKPGPKVGEILRRVAEARRRGEVRSFEEELALARKLLDDGTLALPE